jgi:hypothetical protein
MTNGIGRKESLFAMFSKIRLCGDMKIFFVPSWDCWIWWFEFVLFIILSELTN